uniref:Reverse transcriptase domain-containing protein n=1 Tax=Tanacetum cinerariifolium TaxID=118510 RepID=A0A6L2L426_TANCI|nr:reverse transcriptase domain-containing protein [Tanacetum cinerariifolium]
MRELPMSPRKRDPERKMVFKRLEKGVFQRLEDKGKKEQSLPLRNIITKEHPHTRWKLCQKAKVAHEDTGSQGKKSKGQPLRMMIYPSHGDVKGALEIMRISGFMYGITNPKLIKCLHDIIPKSIDEMMRITTSFLRGEVAAVISSSSYNGIIGRPGVRKIQAVLSTTDGMLKFPVARGVLTIRISKIIPIVCAAVTGLEGQPLAAHQAIEERIKEGCPPVRQKRRSQAADRYQATQEEVKKLIDARIMKEVDYLVGYLIRSTYQHLVDKAFHKQIGRNLDVYVEYLVIKSHTKDEIIRDIEETFKTIREINMKPNQKIMYLRGRRRDVPRLQGQYQKNKVEKSLPFFKTLKKCTKKSNFHWTEEAEAAFKQMKQLIAELPTITAPKEKKSSLSTWRKQKKPRALRGPEVNYTSMEKLVLALVHANKHLKRYFQAHPIIVVTDQPIKQVISKLEVAGRLQKWSIELEEYAIHYRPRVFVEGQILANFIVEYPEEDDSDNAMEIEEELLEPWVLFTDGSSCADSSRAGLILTNPEGAEFTNALRFMFEATNNEAEYEALIAELTIAKEMGVKNLQENVDSRLVANKVNGTYIEKETDMIRI